MARRIPPVRHRYKHPPSYEYPDLDELVYIYDVRELWNVARNKLSRCICQTRHLVTRELSRPVMLRHAVLDGGRWVAIYDYCVHCERRKLYPLTQTNEVFMWSNQVKDARRNPFPV